VVVKSLGQYSGDVCSGLGVGVAIARHTVDASCATASQGGGRIVAYKL
jgi:hypothetical protein